MNKVLIKLWISIKFQIEWGIIVHILMICNFSATWKIRHFEICLKLSEKTIFQLGSISYFDEIGVTYVCTKFHAGITICTIVMLSCANKPHYKGFPRVEKIMKIISFDYFFNSRHMKLDRNYILTKFREIWVNLVKFSKFEKLQQGVIRCPENLSKFPQISLYLAQM